VIVLRARPETLLPHAELGCPAIDSSVSALPISKCLLVARAVIAAIVARLGLPTASSAKVGFDFHAFLP
jgi:hypothetical protein